jgi:uncharacterized protein YecE (DUF72 family)
MDFGKIRVLEGIDLSLPPDHPDTLELLGEERVNGGQANDGEPPALYVGGVQWGCRNWVGKVYPRGTKDRDFLSHYVRQFNTIELNTLFHALQPPDIISRWASLAGPDFLFCPKFSGAISHHLQRKSVQQDTDQFLEHIQYFGTKRGHSFLQLSEGFAPDRSAVLQNYLRGLPRDLPLCLELRHEDWFASPTTPPKSHVRPASSPVVEDTWRLLRELRIGSVITDTAGRRDCLHMRLTAPVAFIRFVANGHPTDYSRLDDWAVRLKDWTVKGLRRIYFFVHSPEELYSPELCRYAIGEFNKQCGSQLRAPVLLDDKPAADLTLF